MWLLRIARQTNWSAGSPTEAARDLTPRRDAEAIEDLSVFQVDSVEEAFELAMLWVATQRRPSNLDYVLLPDDVVRSLCAVEHRPMGDLHPRLAARHHEILGLDSAERIAALAEKLIAANVTATRARERALRAAVHERCETDPELRARLKDGW